MDQDEERRIREQGFTPVQVMLFLDQIGLKRKRRGIGVCSFRFPSDWATTRDRLDLLDMRIELSVGDDSFVAGDQLWERVIRRLHRRDAANGGPPSLPMDYERRLQEAAVYGADVGADAEGGGEALLADCRAWPLDWPPKSGAGRPDRPPTTRS